MSLWVYLMHRVPRRPPGLPVQVITLHENGVTRATADPDVTLAFDLQNDAGTDVASATITYGCE